MEPARETRTRNTIVIRDPLLRKGFTVVPNILFAIKGLSHGARLTYVLLLKYAWREGSCYPGVERMAEELEVERKSVMRYTGELSDRGLITVERRGLTMTNVYYINQVGEGLLENGHSEAEVPSIGLQEVPPVGRPEVPSRGHEERSEENFENGVNGVVYRIMETPTRSVRELHKEADHIEYLIDEIVQVCGDEGSKSYYKRVAQLVPDERIFQFLSEIKADPKVRNRGAVFTSKVKEHLAEKGAHASR